MVELLVFVLISQLAILFQEIMITEGTVGPKLQILPVLRPIT